MNKDKCMEKKKVPEVSQKNVGKQKGSHVSHGSVKNYKKVEDWKAASCMSLRDDNIQEVLLIEDISDEELMRLTIIAEKMLRQE